MSDQGDQDKIKITATSQHEVNGEQWVVGISDVPDGVAHGSKHAIAINRSRGEQLVFIPKIEEDELQGWNIVNFPDATAVLSIDRIPEEVRMAAAEVGQSLLPANVQIQPEYRAKKEPDVTDEAISEEEIAAFGKGDIDAAAAGLAREHFEGEATNLSQRKHYRDSTEAHDKSRAYAEIEQNPPSHAERVRAEQAEKEAERKAGDGKGPSR